MSVSKLTRRGAKVVFGERPCIDQGNGTVYPLIEPGYLFISKNIMIQKSRKKSVDKVENNSSEFRVNKTYFCRETEEKIENFSEQNENLMINDDDIMKGLELENESRAPPKTETSLDKRGKEESRNLCEVKKFQSMNMKLGSKIRERRKLESRAGKLIRIFELGQKK